MNGVRERVLTSVNVRARGPIYITMHPSEMAYERKIPAGHPEFNKFQYFCKEAANFVITLSLNVRGQPIQELALLATTFQLSAA